MNNPNTSLQKIPLIGVVGGIASGKTFVTEQLARRGAAVISADQLAHEVLRLEPVKQKVRERWGDKVFGSDGEVDRAALARIVFGPPPGGPAELKYLEQLTHPKVGELARGRIEALNAAGAVKAIVLDVPLLTESGWHEWCDKIVFVDTPRAVREQRAVQRGWNKEEFARREAAQESLESKRKLADVMIDSSGSPESVQAQIEHVWPSLVDSFPPK